MGGHLLSDELNSTSALLCSAAKLGLIEHRSIWKGLVVNSEVNGAVEQGDLFTYPEGYFIRAAKPEVDSNEFSLCLGIDRMQKSTETDGGAPALDLDRLNVLFEAERGEEKTYVFGRNSDIKVRVSVTPK
jgi:hypothetical protein